MGLHYGFWNFMLLLPEKIRWLVGVLIMMLIILLLWPLDKYILVILIRIRIWLNEIKVGSGRFILLVYRGERRYMWDEKIRIRGKNKDDRLQGKNKKIIKSKRKDVLKWKSFWIIFMFCYIWAILPFFQLEKYIPDHYVNYFYMLNHFFVYAEAKATSGIENYPPFWITAMEEAAQEGENAEPSPSTIVEQSIYLKLNEATAYANIRETPGLRGNKLHVVSKEDEILYQNIYEYDAERFWLKIVLPSYDNLEGWISANVIEQEIVDALDLQY